ncbi:MAG: urea carboxylase [Spartobacteria bacterium]|nr:urea carboxylase [Spartobacteria bacterium]
MFTSVLVANRGEIAVRILKTLKRLNIDSVAVYSEADTFSPHVAMATKSVYLGASEPTESYLRGDRMIDIAKEHGAQAIIPGYGFLSENADFAEECAKNGIVFVGPHHEQMRDFGLKHRARELALQANIPLVPGSGLLTSLDEAIETANELGYPLMLKSTAGGGGIGLTKVTCEEELIHAYESVRRLSQNFFKNDGVFLERFIDHARHIEVQIFGDGEGHIAILGERDCSSQRRNQKVIEETPAHGISDAARSAMHAAARKLGESVAYRSAGTVEFIYDTASDAFYFLEVNTRLQVEHPVTEEVFGIDLVEWMLKTAANHPLELDQPWIPQGASIEVRIYAEDPTQNFTPSPGIISKVSFPTDVRVDSWISDGTDVSPYYDPMLAKLIVKGKNRAEALRKMSQALESTELYGNANNIDYLREIIASDTFQSGRMTTRVLDALSFQKQGIEILTPGTYTTIQDYPGRVGYWDIGVPPSGPVDDYAFRMANSLVGNPDDAAGIECTLTGPTLRFHSGSRIALTGAPSGATLDGEPAPFWQTIDVQAGQVLKLGKVTSGCRTYIAVAGGIDVPAYLGSKSTFVLGQFGGHLGRCLRGGDALSIGAVKPLVKPQCLPEKLIPAYHNHWDIGVLYGPHGAPDFFQPESIEMLFSTDWEVHYNSNRLGIRLLGPKPSWTRSDGGEAGLHPSNIHDCEYAIGSINFTGDMPIILGHDGPSLGGFVCPATIAKAELWKVGQVKPGDTIRFHVMQFDEALALEKARDAQIASLCATPVEAIHKLEEISDAILVQLPAQGDAPQITYRQSGDHYILIEYGPNVLDLRFRFRIYGLMEELKAHPVAGLLEQSPGVRSLQIRYDSRVITQKQLLDKLLEAEQRIPPIESMTLNTRVIHLPLAFEDSATLDAVCRYRQSVRDTAPWLPNNVDFIQRINGLSSREEVRDIVFDASYMVLGLGDVYLGAPCAVPVDPRHRLVTSKYNPARTFTAEGTVGIGGVYMCIYGMDSPGGYQLVGRTLPIWNKFMKNPDFKDGCPWLLRFFDQVRFYPVEEAELLHMREAFREGQLTIKMEEEPFSLAQYNALLTEEADSISAFQSRQKEAFTQEVALWNQQEDASPVLNEPEPAEEIDDIDGVVLTSDIHANVWKLLVEVGQEVKQDDPVIILEAMKMEITVRAPVSGVIQSIHCTTGKQVLNGTPLLAVKE